MKKTFLFFTVILLSAIAMADQQKGAEKMILKGGSSGDVEFPHRTHQNALADCGKCHNLFPQTANAIQSAITEGKLIKKQVMNQCRDCHRDLKKEGLKTGPTSCKKCHNIQ